MVVKSDIAININMSEYNRSNSSKQELVIIVKTLTYKGKVVHPTNLYAPPIPVQISKMRFLFPFSNFFIPCTIYSHFEQLSEPTSHLIKLNQGTDSWENQV